MVISSPSSKMPAKEQFDSFLSAVNDTFSPVTCERAGGSVESFGGHLEASRLESMHLAQVHSAPIDVFRRKAHIAEVSDDFYLVKFQVEGQGFFSQRGREAELVPGDFVLASTTEPYELHFPKHYRQAVLAIPHSILNQQLRNPEQYLGQRMAADQGSNGLLSQFVLSLLQRIDGFEPALAQRLEANILDLLVTSLSFSTPTQRLERDSRVEHIYRVKNFIYKHLADPQLTPDMIAQSQGISTRYLHMLFKPEGLSVGRYIQLQRLEGCKGNLENPEMNSFSATEIAFRWGFNDASHFGRCFKAQYGVTPSQYRKRAQG
ncbi:helix-turn-helix domain-containing protein [Pseudomaricurvus alkylphenolicus]|jgi:AraC-like DNA-binding protein|uniref:AraC-like ligand-binding domain-containing protein n=1 Tax=Pseudomaricurvus alkylphenolicus TaxID=1306991 RepID=UPI001422A712|nr:helix-turn-helix domain-containing protein [Pseudomaricurvus alkylphenolicus]NIB40908.1 helix-turn-helix domain-containing protein [Pseudomaricurvus alkylphenolicus]